MQRRLITRCIEDVIAAAERELEAVSPSSSDDVRAAGRALVRFSPDVAIAERGLKDFLFGKVYRSDAVMAPVRASQDMVAALFDRYLATSDLPGRWGEIAGAAVDDTSRARIIADFIAGMTDPYAEDEYARLFDGKRPLE